MIRFFDILISITGIILLSPLFFFIFVIGLVDTGSPLFLQKRVGLNLKSFVLVKFRTMKLNTLSKGTHLVDLSHVTYFGHHIRRFKIDELPQLWNVLKGDMSIVGPRPCLLNQKRLIYERKKRKVFKVKPGITGLAQVSNLTMKSATLLAKTDSKMIKKMNLYYYFYYILRTSLLFIKQ